MNPIAFVRNLIKILRARPQVPDALKDNPLLKTIVNRRSVRKFSDRPVSDDVFRAILEAGRLAPSTVNLQSWTFVAFTVDLWREKFAQPIPFKGNRAVVVLGDMSRVRQIITTFPHCPLVEYTVAVMNASLAAMNMTLAAEALGVSSVMLSETGKSGFFDAKYLKEHLVLPDDVFPLMTIVFGYAKGAYPPMPPKLPFDSVVTNTANYRQADRRILEDWYHQMTAGFKATNPLSSFEAQLNHYGKNIERAEQELADLIFHEGRGASPSDREEQ